MIISYDTESPVGYTASGVLGLVCLTYSLESDKESSHIITGQPAVDLWLEWMRDDSITLLAHSNAHDMCVMAQAANPTADPGSGWAYELVFRKYEKGLARCTYIRQRLIDIEAGVGYLPAGLGPLAKRLELGETQEKKPNAAAKIWLKSGKPVQEWPPEVIETAPARIKYGLWSHLPPDQWPAHALKYALDDPLFCWGVWESQPAGVLPDELAQTRAALDLEILSKHGWVTDLPRVKRLLALYGTMMSESYQVMVKTGLVAQKHVWPESDPRHRVDESLSSSAIRALVWDALGAKAPLTKKAKIAWQEIDQKEASGEMSQDEVTTWYASHISTDAEICTQAVAALGAQPLTVSEAIEHVEAGDLEQWIHDSGPSSGAAINARRLYKKAQHRVSHYLKPLDTERRVRSYYNPLLETGRTSTSGPCLNYPRGFDIPDHLTVRGCIVPDRGRVFLVADYSQLELCTQGQSLTDLMRHKKQDPTYLSSLARAINEGMDCHIMVAATLLGATYDEIYGIYKLAKEKKKHQRTAQETEIVDKRQVSKIGNYGFWGGMGAPTFVTHAAKQGVLLTLAQSQRVKDAVYGTWHESHEFFGYIKDLCKRSADNKCSIRLVRSKRIRGGCFYTEAANYCFQGPAADGCKEAARRLVDASFRDKDSELYKANGRPVAFIHDEFIEAADDPLAEMAKDLGGDCWPMYDAAKKKKENERLEFDYHIIHTAELAMKELERHMIEGMRTVTPDVRIEAEGRIMRERWGK